MKTSWKKILASIVIMLLLLSGIYAILKHVGIPLPIKREVTASVVVIGEESTKQAAVKIDGWLRLFIGADNKFEGTVEIEGCEETDGVKVEALGYDGIYVLNYKLDEDGNMAILLSDSLLWSDFAIQVEEGLIFGDGKTVFMYPEPEDVDEKVTELRRKAGWQEELLTEEDTEADE